MLDPWIDHQPLRLYGAADLAARAEAEGATIILCEADEVKGPVFDLPLVAIGSARGDPTNVDLAGATAAGIPVLHAPGRNADGVAELAVALLLAVTRHLLAADHDVRTGAVFRDGSIPYQRFRAWQVAGKTVGIVGLGAARELNDRGLVEGSSGNVSARIDERHVCLTPSSIPCDDMVLDDLVVVDLDGNVALGDKGPTSEKALNLACYRAYPEIGGVIHSHAVYATMFAVAREPIPAAVEEVAVYIGGDVPVAEYTMTGTDELGEEVASHLGDRAAVLVANHGMVTVGTNLDKALHAARLVERTAQTVLGARFLGRVHDVPAEINENFGNVYKLMRSM